MAGYKDFVYILGRGKNKIGLVLGGHFYAILGPVFSSMYKIQNGDSLGVAKISFLFIYLLAHLSRRLMGELIVYQSLRRPSVRRPSVRPSVNIFKHLLL